MQKKIRKVLIFSALAGCMICKSGAVAQPIGGPVLSENPRSFTLGFNTGYLTTKISGIKNSSPRFLFKGVYGAGSNFDLYGEAGLVKLTLQASQANLQNFRDNYHFAVGGGFTFRFMTLNSLGASLFVNTQVFRFTASPTSERALNLGGASVRQILEFDYDWREANVNLGLIKRSGNLKFYGGLNGKAIQRLETRISRNVIGTGQDAGAIEKGEYKSGLQIGSFLGIDLMLPARYFISVELVARGRDDFMINLGISQTGKP